MYSQFYLIDPINMNHLHQMWLSKCSLWLCLTVGWLIALSISLMLGTKTLYAQDAWQQLAPECQQLAQMINQLRIDNHIPPLIVNLKLTQAAQNLADDMVKNNFFGHYGSNGSTHFDRIHKAGYQSLMLGENIAGQWKPEQVVQAWLQDEYHKNNMLTTQFKEFGVAVARGHREGWDAYVVDFGADDTNSQTLPSPLPDPSTIDARTPLPSKKAPTGSDQTLKLSICEGSSVGYSVRPGDSLWRIGKKYRMKWQEIANANQLQNPNVLQVGQTICVPAK